MVRGVKRGAHCGYLRVRLFGRFYGRPFSGCHEHDLRPSPANRGSLKVGGGL